MCCPWGWQEVVDVASSCLGFPSWRDDTHWVFLCGWDTPVTGVLGLLHGICMVDYTTLVDHALLEADQRVTDALCDQQLSATQCCIRCTKQGGDACLPKSAAGVFFLMPLSYMLWVWLTVG